MASVVHFLSYFLTYFLNFLNCQRLAVEAGRKLMASVFAS
jgi:hypothetical protein